VGSDPNGVAFTPDQAPVAQLSVTPNVVGQPSSFDASASTVAFGTIASYSWNFGDGTTATTTSPTTTHTYTSPGTYNASVSETSSGGTSTTQVFTGQTVSQNGGPQAVASASVDVLTAGPNTPQTITFTAPASGSVGGSALLDPSASSGLAVALSVDASTTNSSCSLSGHTVDYLHTGTCVIDANQAGNGNYLAAAQAQQSVAVGKGSQAIVFTSTPPANAVVGGAAYTPTATGGASGNPVVFTIDASAAGVCSTDGVTVAFTGVGTCVIDANQAGDTDYLAASPVKQTIAVATVPGAPTLTRAAAGNNQVALTWTAPTNNGGATINSYNILRATTSGAETLLQSRVSGTTYTDVTAANGTTYYYRVEAVNSAGTGPASNELSAHPRRR
jgi:hypothetical protein